MTKKYDPNNVTVSLNGNPLAGFTPNQMFVMESISSMPEINIQNAGELFEAALHDRFRLSCLDNTLEMLHHVRIDLRRILQFPRFTGWFTLLHHEGPVIEESYNVLERILYILQYKPEHEIETRLNNIYPVDERQAIELLKLAFYARTREMQNQVHVGMGGLSKLVPFERYEMDWLRRHVPHTTWNGRSIFSHTRPRF